jgi:uroporphyrinogen-III synthase
VAPLLEVRAVADAVIDLTDVSAIAFTSANAVAAYAALCGERQLRAFAVGDATAAAARAIGFRTVLSAQGDVQALAAALAARRRELTGPILFPAAAEPAQDLPGALADVGLACRSVVVYGTVEVRPSASLIAHLPELGGVLVHSAKAARVLATLLEDHPAPHLIGYCLSPQAARPLASGGLAAVLSAAAPNEAALLALLPRSRSD